MTCNLLCQTLRLPTLAFLVMLSGQAWGEIELPRPDCVTTSATVDVEGGIVHYNRAGDGAPIILLHGLFAQKEQWNSVLCDLAAAGFDAIAPDLPGFGQSHAFPVTAYDLKRQVGLLHQFVDALRLVPIDLAGNSMGGTIAALFAQQYPERVERLAFIGPPLGVEAWGSDVQRTIIGGINPFIPTDRAQFELEMSLLFDEPPDVPAEYRDEVIRDYVSNNRRYQQVWNIVNLFDSVLDDCERGPLEIDAPTLIVWGESDRIYPVSGADSLRERLPGSRLTILPDTGHLPMVEKGTETSAHLIRFLRDGP